MIVHVSFLIFLTSDAIPHKIPGQGCLLSHFYAQFSYKKKKKVPEDIKILPEDIKIAESVSGFKSSFKSKLFSVAFC